MSAGYAQDEEGPAVYDPGLWSYVRRYSKGSPLPPTTLIARLLEQAAQPHHTEGDDLDAALAEAIGATADSHGIAPFA